MPPRPAAMEADEIVRFLQDSGVAPGARLLDAPCGLGQRARGLAERGYRVTAVDPNEVAIETLRKRMGKEAGHRLECRTATAASLPGLPADERFDAVLCLDHAISREPSGDDGAFLRRLRGHTARNGLLLLDLLHRDFFASRPRPFAYHVLGKVEQHEFRRFDAASGVLELTWKFYQREGGDLRFRGSSAARLKLVAPDEAVRILEDAGWGVVGVNGGWDKQPVSADRRKLLIVAHPRGVK